MEEEWIVDRSKLREVWFEHPNWSLNKMAVETSGEHLSRTQY
jgi:hypothetical protein